MLVIIIMNSLFTNITNVVIIIINSLFTNITNVVIIIINSLFTNIGSERPKIQSNPLKTKTFGIKTCKDKGIRTSLPFFSLLFHYFKILFVWKVVQVTVVRGGHSILQQWCGISVSKDPLLPHSPPFPHLFGLLQYMLCTRETLPVLPQ